MIVNMHITEWPKQYSTGTVRVWTVYIYSNLLFFNQLLSFLDALASLGSIWETQSVSNSCFWDFVKSWVYHHVLHVLAHLVCQLLAFFKCSELSLSWAPYDQQNYCKKQVQPRSELRGLLQPPRVPKLADPHNTKIGPIADIESFLEYMYFTEDLNKHLNSRSNGINVNFSSQL